MSNYEIYNYEVTRKRIRDELRVVDGVSIEDLNKKDIADFIDKTRQNHINLVNVTDSQLLEFMGVTKNNKVTIAGLITFHDYPQYIFPQLQISVVRIPGQKIGLTDENGVRFLANQSFTGNIKQMLKDSYDFIVRNLSVSTIIGNDGMRHDKYEYPLLAIREGLLNSLEHRDYSKYTEGFPIRVEIYSDSLLIKSPGYLYGNSDISELGKGIFETRNPALVNILSILNIGENRYSGIPTMRAEMEKANLLPPKFYNRNDSFILELDNEVYIQNLDCASVNSVLEYCLFPRSREEIIKFVNKSRNYVLSNIISPLIKEGKLGLTMPTKPQSPFQKYYTKQDNK